MSENRDLLKTSKALFAIVLLGVTIASIMAIGVFLLGFVREAHQGGIDFGVRLPNADAVTTMAAGGLLMAVLLIGVMVLWGVNAHQSLKYRRRVQELESRTRR